MPGSARTKASAARDAVHELYGWTAERGRSEPRALSGLGRCAADDGGAGSGRLLGTAATSPGAIAVTIVRARRATAQPRISSPCRRAGSYRPGRTGSCGVRTSARIATSLRAVGYVQVLDGDVSGLAALMVLAIWATDIDSVIWLNTRNSPRLAGFSQRAPRSAPSCNRTVTAHPAEGQEDIMILEPDPKNETAPRRAQDRGNVARPPAARVPGRDRRCGPP